MQTLANVLYVTTQGAYVRRNHETLQVKIEGKVKLTVPLHHLEGLMCFGQIQVSSGVYAICADKNLHIAMLSQQGRFLARAEGCLNGNVLLRRQQYRLADESAACLAISKPMIAGKVQNARNLMLRSARDSTDACRSELLRKAAAHLAALLEQLAGVDDLEVARGIEGASARTYFESLKHMIHPTDEAFRFDGRTRRPPESPVNALLSFVYALLRHDCESALHAVGLDSGVGYLHADRPGRPSLALDLMEEFRALIADRLVLALINRRQVSPTGFQLECGRAVSMDDKTRRTVLAAYQERKREQIKHPLFEESVCVGLLPHLQARLLARTIRGDLENYPAIVIR